MGPSIHEPNFKVIVNKAFKISLLTLTACLFAWGSFAQKDNTLSKKEKKEGWTLLFDGKTTKGWRGAYKDAFPDSGWAIKEGVLMKIPSAGGESRAGGDIITTEKWENFELTVDFRVSPKGNSGIKYYVNEQTPKPAGSAIGLEFQILDDEGHPDAKMGKNGNRTIGSLYDLIPASTNKKPFKPGTEFNTARIVSNNKKVEHWLNGVKVVEYERGSEAFRTLVAGSKYKNYPAFGEAEKGHILLQDHGDKVEFKNIKIRKL